MKADLIIKRELEDVDDLAPFDAEVQSIVEPFGAELIGQGTYLPTMTCDWQYEVDMDSARIVAEKLRRQVLTPNTPPIPSTKPSKTRAAKPGGSFFMTMPETDH